MDTYYKEIAIKLARVLQAMEREGIDLPVDIIREIWNLKINLGMSIPASIEEGTGAFIGIRSFTEEEGKQWDRHIKTISKPTGRNFYDKEE